MAAAYQGLYEGITFPEYEFREYPKFIQTGEKKDPLTGNLTPTGVTVNSLAEEEAITRPKQPPQPAAEPEPKAAVEPAPAPKAPEPVKEPVSELDRLRAAYVTAKGEEPDKRWGVGKLQHVLSSAEAADDSDPDA